MKTLMKFLFSATLVALCMQVSAQSVADSTTKKEKYEFTEIISLKTAPVKSQDRSGTCWSYGATSFIESEIIRKGGPELDLSEMYFVRMVYPQKADKFVRLHGAGNYSGGGQFHDVFNVIKTDGFVTENDFTGKTIGEKIHVHGEMDAVSKAYLIAVIKNRNRKLTPVWFDAYQGILDAYLGEIPQTVVFEEQEITPFEFSEKMNFDANDYVEITSYTNYPFYEKIKLDIPDNWSWDEYYNVPLNELMEIIDYSLENGYTVAWDGDVSEKGFSHTKGVAIVPEDDKSDLSGSERDRWEKLSKKEKSSQLYSFEKPVTEKKITQELRQEHFDNYSSTDDHLMHLTGMVKDQNGTIYYIIKNSWGTDRNEFGGYFNMSESYAKLNTTAIMVHKESIPKAIRKKLGIK